MGYRVGAASLLIAALAACGGDGGSTGDWAGTVADSAGIPVVQNPSEGLWSPESAWALEEVLSIGEMAGEVEYQFGQVIGVDVDAAGNVYVADVQASDVRVYDAQGVHVRTLGQPGAGPGEIGAGLSGVFVTQDEVIAPDLGNARLNRFGLDGEVLSSHPIDILAGVPVRWDRIGASVVAQLRAVNPGGEAEPAGDIVVTMGDPEAPRDTLTSLPIGQSVQFSGGQPRARIFASEPIWDAGSSGRVLMGKNDNFRIEVRDDAGTVERVITLPFEQKPVTERDRRVFLDAVGDAARQQGAPPAAVEAFLQTVEFADFYPAFATLSVGPAGSTWVQRIKSGDEIGGDEDFDPQDVGSPIWDVFDDEGRYLGPLTFPGRYQPIKVAGDRIYGIDRDELDIQRVKVYRVVMQ